MGTGARVIMGIKKREKKRERGKRKRGRYWSDRLYPTYVMNNA